VTVPIAGTTNTAAVAYTYDELGRVVSRSIDSANPVGTTFDALSRVTNVTNALAPTSPGFQYAYVDQTSRLSGVTYPSGTGLSTTYGYFGNTSSDGNPGDDDQRLSEIKNVNGSTQLSDFKYTYNHVGTIATWTQQADSNTAVVNTLTYDNADQLTGNVQSGGAATTYGYGYDPAGNRLTGTLNSATTAGQFNKLNQLTGLTGSPTSQTVAGFTSTAITNATVNAVPATISNSTNFTANVQMPSGTNVVSVVAQPTSSTGAITTQRYQIVATGSAPTALTYDANGNCTQDESGNTYTWDALNRLVGIAYHAGTYSGTHTEFSYDGLSRRVQILEKSGTTYGSGTATSTKNYLWIGQEIAEERNAGNTVTKRFFPQGEQQINSGTATSYYYTFDHLGSTREMTNSSGTIVARYDYDPFGRTTLVSGTNLATFQYAGYYVHQPSGLNLTWFRAYDANTDRWLSRDPLGEGVGPNLYGYVNNDPIDYWDPFGLDYTQTGPALSLDTDTHDKTKPKDPSHQNSLPAHSPGNGKYSPGVVAPEEAQGVKMGDPAYLITNGQTVKCKVIDRSTNTNASHTDKPEANPAAARAAGLKVKGGTQGAYPSAGPGDADVPASIYFPTATNPPGSTNKK
jgi:RHS repeat-associated protein